MITVIGYDGTRLSLAALEAIADAELVVGGERHLAQVPAGVKTLVWSDISGGIDALLELDGDGVIVASGDPGLFGPVRRLREVTDDLQVLPAVSSVQAAFARAQLPWDDALVVSAHGRDPRQALNVCRAHPKVAVLTGPASGPEVLGAALVGHRRELFVCELLGEPDERCTWMTPAEAAAGSFAEPNLVIVVDRTREVAPMMGWIAGRHEPSSWALPDDAFEHRDGMITKAEVRALVLARLGPRLGDLVWDIGAGSGSVGIECARLGAAVIAVEKASLEHLQANIEAFGVDVQVVHGTAPDALVDLPDPDAVFVGGGASDVGAIVRWAVARRPRIVVVALAALDRLAEVQQALAPYRVEGVQLQASRFRALGEATGLAATNPVLVVWGTRS
ncbi:MAG: precorrin-6y C5,15-methyltransferase (decarboxylating), CbiE subunit [Frankiales bacterium]|nr:precorrin-6y C5,15-methyltransferase (decarboxylating), CbiE subunit [Frankiales bacterium]